MKSISMRLGEDSVTVLYRASKDFDNTGDFWEIEWNDVSVMNTNDVVMMYGACFVGI